MSKTYILIFVCFWWKITELWKVWIFLIWNVPLWNKIIVQKGVICKILITGALEIMCKPELRIHRLTKIIGKRGEKYVFLPNILIEIYGWIVRPFWQKHFYFVKNCLFLQIFNFNYINWVSNGDPHDMELNRIEILELVLNYMMLQ